MWKKCKCPGHYHIRYLLMNEGQNALHIIKIYSLQVYHEYMMIILYDKSDYVKNVWDILNIRYIHSKYK